MHKVSERYGLLSDGPPVHPNCTCPTSVVEAEDGTIFEVIWPSPSACDLCHEVADAVMEEVFGKGYGEFVGDYLDETAPEEEE